MIASNSARSDRVGLDDPLVEHGHAVLCQRADGELTMPGMPDLANDEHVQRQVQRLRDPRRHHHPPRGSPRTRSARTPWSCRQRPSFSPASSREANITIRIVPLGPKSNRANLLAGNESRTAGKGWRSAPVPGRSNVRKRQRCSEIGHVRRIGGCCARGRAHSADVALAVTDPLLLRANLLALASGHR